MTTTKLQESAPALSILEQAAAGLRERFHKAGITSVAIIDDVYAGIGLMDVATSWPAVKTGLQKLGAESTTYIQKHAADLLTGEVDLEGLRVLAAQPGCPKDVLELLAPVLKEYSKRKTELDSIEVHLRKVGLEPRQYTPDKIPQDEKLVLLDYKLNEGGDASARSREIASALAERKAGRPFLILISDLDAFAARQAEFRKATRYLGGTFGFISKPAACDPAQFLFYLETCGVGDEVLVPLQAFFESVDLAVAKVAGSFREDVSVLNAQDYAFIQRLSLHEDGQGLGEYISQLFGAALSYRFRDESSVASAANKLDGLHFPRYLPASTQPSSAILGLYKCALTEPNVGAIGYHPQQAMVAARGGEALPFLAFGDVLAASSDRTCYLVVNPACDLQFSPLSGRRDAEPDQPVYLMPGTFRPLHKPGQSEDEMCTEPFEYEGRSWCIDWGYKRVSTVALGEFLAWKKAQSVERIGRLSLPYALQIQQVWTSYLGRVGLSVRPPMCEGASVQVYTFSPDGWTAFKSPVPNGAILIPEKSQFVLTLEAAYMLQDALEKVSAIWEQKAREEPEGEHQQERIASHSRKAAAARENRLQLKAWRDVLCGENSLPSPAGAAFVAGQVCVCCAAARNEAGKLVNIRNGQAQVLAEIVRSS